MKKILTMLIMALVMTAFTTSAAAQTAGKGQRISREQLAEVQAKHIAHSLAFDEKTTARFIDTYTQCQKEVWALGPRLRSTPNNTEEQNEQAIKQRFEMSQKILNIREKYYKTYSQFLTQAQIQRVYELERQMMKRLEKNRQNGKRKALRRPGSMR